LRDIFQIDLMRKAGRVTEALMADNQ